MITLLISVFIWMIALTPIAGTYDARLRDHAIVGRDVFYLDGSWKLDSGSSNGVTSVKGTIPGDIITDLETAGLIPDPYFDDNWLHNSSVWNSQTWTYSTLFTVKGDWTDVLLVFDGVKMGAQLRLNGRDLGVARDQFLRYAFSIGDLVQLGDDNLLEVVFPKNNSGIDVQGRYMACTGGWDWAPYSNTYDQHGAHTFSKGIWKSVYLAYVDDVAISHVVPSVFYEGEYPTQPLDANHHGGFRVDVDVWLYAPKAVSGRVELSGSWTSEVSSLNVSLQQGDNKVKLSKSVVLHKDRIFLWWPNGLGQQPLYNVSISFTSTSASTFVVQATRRIGFRVFALVTSDDSDPAKLKHEDGSGNLTMRFRVNGASVFIRGSNMIPMEELEGRADADAFSQLVASAADANINLLRVWGGGIFFYDWFYDLCDQHGLLLYHDMMYAQQGHAPNTSETQELELRYQIRRLAAHPSIVIWDGCNECKGQGIYSNFVMSTVAQEDQSRVVWPSCPSSGWASGVSRLWGTPNGKPLVPNPYSTIIEEHGPYEHGSGWPTVNGRPLTLFPANLPPNISSFNASDIGIYKRGYFASEFGCSTMSSFESMSPLISESSWGLHSKPMLQRNYPCDNIIDVYWGSNTGNLNETGTVAFQKQLYQCQLGQALEMKSNIEVRRAGNTFGTTVWQLGEVWPTGGWGSLEYGSPVKGQVVGGRWKPLHFLYKQSVFRDVIASCGPTGSCYLRNDDAISDLDAYLRTYLISLSSGKRMAVRDTHVRLPKGAASIMPFCFSSGFSPCLEWPSLLPIYGCKPDGSDCIALISVQDKNGKIEFAHNLLPLTTPGNMALHQAHIVVSFFFHNEEFALIDLKSDNVAIFVTLTTSASGRFAQSMFMLIPNETYAVRFNFIGPADFEGLRDTLRVEHVGLYL